MKVVKLIYIDEYEPQFDTPYITSIRGLDTILSGVEEVKVYTSSLIVFVYFRVLIKRGIIDNERSYVEYRGDKFYFDKSGRADLLPDFDALHMELLCELL